MNQVLVVDDSHVIRRLVEVVLEQINIEVVTVGNGSKACEALERCIPDLLILDVMFPGNCAGGSDTAKAITVYRIRQYCPARLPSFRANQA